MPMHSIGHNAIARHQIIIHSRNGITGDNGKGEDNNVGRCYAPDCNIDLLVTSR